MWAARPPRNSAPAAPHSWRVRTNPPGAKGVASLQSARMDVPQLRTLVAVVRHGSFAAAARQLDLDPSVVTRTIAALERELGVRLMHRTTRRLTLTEAGAAYCEHARVALEALDRGADEAHAGQGELRGIVRVTASVAYGQARVVPLMAALHERHPRLEIELMLTDAMVDLVHERVDLAIRLGPSVDPALVGVPLAPLRYRVVTSPAYLRRHGRPRTPDDLAQAECLRYPLPGFGSQWNFRAGDGAVQTVAVHGWLTVSTFLALHRATVDGLGPALLPHWLVDADLEAGRLVDLFPQHDVSASNFDSAVWLQYASRDYLPRRVRAVVDFFKESLAAR